MINNYYFIVKGRDEKGNQRTYQSIAAEVDRIIKEACCNNEISMIPTKEGSYQREVLGILGRFGEHVRVIVK